MSYSCDEAYDVYDEKHVRARKAHLCDACKETIPSGHTYWRIGMVYDERAETVRRCERCQKIHLHLRDLCRKADHDLWPDERLDCGLEYEEEWGALPPEIEALAFVRPIELQEQKHDKRSGPRVDARREEADESVGGGTRET